MSVKTHAATLLLTAVLVLSACAGGGIYQINLMPPPEVFEEDVIDPFVDAIPIGDMPYDGVLYATDRLPSEEGPGQHFYLNERGHVLRLGVAQVELARADFTWEDARRISILKSGTEKYPIRVSGVSEFGVLDRTATEFISPDVLLEDPPPAGASFAGKVNAKIALSKRKHIYVYVHGYKVTFENPILVAAELWHFLGYDGVFVAYAWPSTPSRWAYLRDIDTVAGYARHLRTFLEYLAEETDAEQIHVIGYSMGTRLVIRAIAQLALMHHEYTSEEIQGMLRIGHVILAGSDLDREVARNYFADGFLEPPQHVAIYMSKRDQALGLARFLTRRKRLGQMWAEEELAPHIADYLHEREADLSVINVTAAEGVSIGNGHAYFRDSTWVSSDVLMTLAHDLSPGNRGLVRSEDGSPIWTFPPDYIKRLRAALIKAIPKHGEAISQMQDQR